MKKILEKFDIRIKLLFFFFLLIVLPYISLICIAYSKLEDYAGNNSGRTMEDTMISISSQVHSAIEMYGDNSTGLYYNGCVEMFENGSATREYIEYALGAVSYPYKDIRFTYLKSGDQEYCNGLIQYSDLNKAMEPYYQEIVDAGGRPKWYAIDDLYGRYQRKMFVMGRILNGKKQKNIGVLYYVLRNFCILLFVPVYGLLSVPETVFEADQCFEKMYGSVCSRKYDGPDGRTKSRGIEKPVQAF